MRRRIVVGVALTLAFLAQASVLAMVLPPSAALASPAPRTPAVAALRLRLPGKTPVVVWIAAGSPVRTPLRHGRS